MIISYLCRIEMFAFKVHTWRIPGGEHEGNYTMSTEELDRIKILEKVKKKELKQKKAAYLLGISTRQIRRWVRRYKSQGAAGTIHKLRGKTGNRKAEETVLANASALYRKEYSDFTITMAHEKLVELHHFPYGRETLRKQLIQEQLRQPKQHSVFTVHTMRETRL